MRYQRVTVRLPFNLIQRARFLVKHRRTHYSLVGLIMRGLAREVTRVERKEQVYLMNTLPIRLKAGRRKVYHGTRQPKPR